MAHDTEAAVHGMDSCDPRQRRHELSKTACEVLNRHRYHDELTSTHDHLSSLPIHLPVQQQDVGTHLSKYGSLSVIRRDEDVRRAEIEDSGFVNVIANLRGQIQKTERLESCHGVRIHCGLIIINELPSLDQTVVELKRFKSRVGKSGRNDRLGWSIVRTDWAIHEKSRPLKSESTFADASLRVLKQLSWT